MLKPATTNLSPLICLWPERALFVGRLDRVAPHRHAAAVCLVALEGELRVRIESEHRWRVNGSALIPPGCMHALDLRNNLTAVLYNDPHRPHYRQLSRRELQAPAFDLAGEASMRKALRGFYEHASQAQGAQHENLEATLNRVLKIYTQPPTLDPRIERVLAAIQADLAQSHSLATLATTVALSPSRLQHLFLAEIGVPLRRFRIWLRFRDVLQQLVNGATFTHAAFSVGFASSAHFSHAFKDMFGVSPASVMANWVTPRIIFKGATRPPY